MQNLQPIMVQGTSSGAGKTTIVAGLCRLYANRGVHVAPFKSQNMALNSYVTLAGEEIGRSTAVQAEAARQTPIVHMNPLLLKPKADSVAQLIVHGRPLRDVDASDYFAHNELTNRKWTAIRESIAYMRGHFELIVAEGAGSCAEPNLREYDVVNMAIAHELGAKVYLVTDIDRGGSFADILGSLRVMELTRPEDLTLVAGFIINKFRGDISLLTPAIEFLERHTGLPVAGVLPYLYDLEIEEEDEVRPHLLRRPEIDIAVLHLPHISNANDFDYLALEPGVQVRYVRRPDKIGRPDAVIIPGTKNTVGDLVQLRTCGFADILIDMAGDVPIFGICGGYQMLGKTLHDPDRNESSHGTIPGLGLFDLEVWFHAQKLTVQRTYRSTPDSPFAFEGTAEGYEIHAGQVVTTGCAPLFEHAEGFEGAFDAARLVYGTFVHDVFKNAPFTRQVINQLRARKGLAPLTGPLPSGQTRHDEQYDRLARLLAEHTSL